MSPTYGLEQGEQEVDSLPDRGGFLRWVKDNFGAWDLPRIYASLGNSSALTSQTLEWVTQDVLAINMGSTNVVPKRVDASRPIVLKVAEDNKVYYRKADGALGDAYDDVAGHIVPAATFGRGLHSGPVAHG